jgi:hypothetical protein
MYRVSRNWQGISDLIPAMKAHLQAIGMMKNSTAEGSTPSSMWDEPDFEMDSSAIFRAQFCVAADELANRLSLPLRDLGTLHDQMMMTGTVTVDLSSRSVKSGDASQSEDLEAGRMASLWGKGQVMFVVREVNEEDSQKLINLGFRFANLGLTPGKGPSKVLDIMSQSMQVKKSDLLMTIGGLRRLSIDSVESDPKARQELRNHLEGNVHYIALFALRPGFKSSGCRWEILVHRDNPNMIPCYPISDDNEHIYEQLSALEVTARDANDFYKANMTATNGNWARKGYFSMVLEAINALNAYIPRAIMDNAVFSGTPIKVPVGTIGHGTPSYATVWAFTVIPDVHNSNLAGVSADLWSWIPFNFFQCLQRVGDHSPDHAILARKSHIEFAQLFTRSAKTETKITSVEARPSISEPTGGRFSMIRRWRNHISPIDEPDNGIVGPDNSSEKALVRSGTKDRDEGIGKEGGFSLGGIMISQDIHVDTGTRISSSGIEMQDLGVKSMIGTSIDEQPTWVDRIFGLLSAKWSKPGMRELPGRH